MTRSRLTLPALIALCLFSESPFAFPQQPNPQGLRIALSSGVTGGIIRVRVELVSQSDETAVDFGDAPIVREVADVNARVLPACFTITDDLPACHF